MNVLGFQTHRDHFAVAFNEAEIRNRTSDMRNTDIDDESLASKYAIKNNRDWKLSDARKSIAKLSDREIEDKKITCSFRPFDNRPCFFGSEFMDYPRRELIDHAARRNNIHLLSSRQIGVKNWKHAYVAAFPAESCCISDGSTEQNYCFPAKLHASGGNRENLTLDFRTYLDARYLHHYEPEEVFGYIYAVLHAPIYRTLYAEFLRIDFPRIPFPESGQHFESLSDLGWQLAQAHLLRDLPRKNLAGFNGKGDRAVEQVRYSPADKAISINSTQTFAPVSQPVWDFFIGGYQVLDKYLKSRKGRVLSLDEINHVASVADSLAFTIDQMALIDEAYQKAFPDS